MSFFKAGRHSSTESQDPCPHCGTVGTSGRLCPNPLCGHEIPINIGQVVGDPLIDAGQEIGRAGRKFAGETSQALGGVLGTVGGTAVGNNAEAAAMGGAAIFMAFQEGGIWMGMSLLVAAYVGLVGTPSLLALYCTGKLAVLFWSVWCGLLIGGLLGLMVSIPICRALRRHGKSCLWFFLPVAGVAVWLTLRIPGAVSAWWDATPWW